MDKYKEIKKKIEKIDELCARIDKDLEDIMSLETKMGRGVTRLRRDFLNTADRHESNGALKNIFKNKCDETEENYKNLQYTFDRGIEILREKKMVLETKKLELISLLGESSDSDKIGFK